MSTAVVEYYFVPLSLELFFWYSLHILFWYSEIFTIILYSAIQNSSITQLSMMLKDTWKIAMYFCIIMKQYFTDRRKIIFL